MLQLSQRPLSSSAADAEMFVDRERELTRLTRAVDLGFNVLVLGERGVGVTSLVNQLAAHVLESGIRVRHVNASRAENAADLIDQVEASLRALHVSDAAVVREELHGTLGQEPSVGARLLEALLAVNRMSERHRAADALTEIEELPTKRGVPKSAPPVVILVDEAHDPEVVHGVFGRLRDELWELPFTWVVCGDQRFRSAYLEPPADSFFDDVLQVGPLDTDASLQLIQRRLERAGQSNKSEVGRLSQELHSLVEAGEGNPRRLLSAARQLLLVPPEEAARHRGASEDLMTAASGLGRAAAMLAAELQSLGPSSASDPELLERLGWTRPRATQVLRQLEDAGLVTATTDRDPDQPGRPRKLYRLNYDTFTEDREHVS